MAIEYKVRERAAFEIIDGQRIDYDGLGTVPSAGDEAPGFLTLTLVDPNKFGFGNHITTWKELSDGPIILHPLIGASQYQILQQTLPSGVSLFIVTSETPDDVVKHIKKQDLTVSVLSSYDSIFGKQFGIWLQNHENPEDPEIKGMLQRSLFVLSRNSRPFEFYDPRTLLYVETIEDQGGPQPNFSQALEIAAAAA